MSMDSEMMVIAKVFFEESREGLDIMENGLLNLEASPDGAEIHSIFRAAHSIKGGAATFGFSEMASLTHHVETLLDEMRNGKRVVTAEAVRALLKSCDCLRAMIDGINADQPFNDKAIAALRVELEALLVSTDPAGQANASGKNSVYNTTMSVAKDAESPIAAGWAITFEPIPEFLKLRNDPARIFLDLESLGRVSARANVTLLTVVEPFDPELCYLRWTLALISSCSREQLDAVLGPIGPANVLTVGPLTPDLPSQSFPAWIDSQLTQSPETSHSTKETDADDATSAATNAQAAGGSDVVMTTALCAEPRRSTTSRNVTESGSIRVATEKVDHIINLVGELLITQSMLGRYADAADPQELDTLRQGLIQLARNTRELQESVMQVRMLPISVAFNRIPRIVRDLTHKLGKKVELHISGESTELDKTVLEKITDPLVHLVRNALDHGLETPERRSVAGKKDSGRLELNAYHAGGNIIIEVRDDGAGLNKERILLKARERGLVNTDQPLSDEQVHNLIFMPGFSTAEAITDVSGRGVGMDVVRRNINDLGGHVQITSREGQGSVIRIRLPLTLAILDGQLVRVGIETYVISLLSIVETIQVQREQISEVAGRTELFRLRHDYLPVIKLYDLFSIQPDSENTEDGLLVVVEADGTRVGLLVDDLLAQQQIVIKSLESNFKQVRGLAGATILGDGQVALILDIPGVIAAASSDTRHEDISRVALGLRKPNDTVINSMPSGNTHRGTTNIGINH